MVTVLADRHLYKIEELVPEHVDLRLYNSEEKLPGEIAEADALLIRTVTPINSDTLRPIPDRLKFIATCSAGTDHVDVPYLDRHGIAFAYSAGCNANSVAEYVITGLLIWAEQKQVDLANECVGIIGVGHVGSSVRDKLELLGLEYVAYDPPKSERDPSFTSSALEELLDCSILTFHTPLTRGGPYPTHHWLDGDKLSNHSFKLIINTSRGAVLNESRLLEALDTEKIGDLILDVWYNEPNFTDRAAQKAFIATPHIAGYSVQSIFRATKMGVEALAERFSLDLPDRPLPNTERVSPSLSGYGADGQSLGEILCHLHPLNEYQNGLEQLIGLERGEKSRKFNRLRISVPFRNEYPHIRIPDRLRKEYPVLNRLFYRT